MRMVRVIQAQRHLTDTEVKQLRGHRLEYDPASFTLVTDDCDVVLPTGRYLCRFRKGVIPRGLCKTATEGFHDVSKLVVTNRGYAAGMSTGTSVRTTHIGNKRFDKSPPAHSIVAGYMDSANWSRPCRLTAFSKDHMGEYRRSMPFFTAIDNQYAALFPKEHSLQKREAMATEFHIKGTAFSTITVNYDWQTAVHKDRGDFKKGFGNLVVCGGGYTGGYLMFPQYRIAIDVREGDFLGMDNHEFHCNSPIVKTKPTGFRMSFVCYLRNNMSKCTEINAWVSKKGKQGVPGVIAMILGPKFKTEELGKGKKGERWYRCFTHEREVRYEKKFYKVTDLTQATPRVFHTFHEACKGLGI